MASNNIQQRTILAYHPHLHVVIKGLPHILCFSVPGYSSDEELNSKMLSVLGSYDLLAESPKTAQQALADHDITDVHWHPTCGLLAKAQ